MCGIAGYLKLKSEKGEFIKSHITESLIGLLNRGKDGFGIYYCDKHNGDKFLKIACKVDNRIVTELISAANPYLWDVMLANARAEPTTEYIAHKTREDQQPYHSDDWVIVHNGTIANDKELRSSCPDCYPSNIDSAAIIEMLNKVTRESSIQTPQAHFASVVSKLKGSFAIIAYYKKNPEFLMVACNYKPLYITRNDSAWFINSEKQNLPSKLVFQLSGYSVATLYNSGLMETNPINPIPFSDMSSNTNKKALIVASGGMDSTVVAAKLKKEGYEISLLHLYYGCKAETSERAAIRAISEYFNCDLIMQELPIYRKQDSNLLNPNVSISGGEEGAEFAHEWVPARNLVMLSIAIAIAEARGFDVIALGNNLEESGAYPDNEPDLIRKMNELMMYAIGADKKIEIVMPVGNLMKPEIVKLGLEINAPLHLTWSCYKEGEKHCGKCGPCYMRKKSFEICGKDEVIEYAQ